MIEVVQTTPTEGSADIYLDQEITIQFNKAIKTSHIDPEYIKLYRVYSEAGTEKYAQTNIIVAEQPDNTVSISPAINLLENSLHKLLIRGDLNVSDGIPSGIEATDDDILDGNFILQFTTGTEVSPVTGDTDPGYDVDDVDGDPVTTPSTGANITVLESSINDLDYGIESLETLDITFSEDVTIAGLNAVKAVTRSLDPRYVEKVDLVPSGIFVSGDISKISFSGHVYISGNTMIRSEDYDTLPYNHEYEITLDKAYIQGDVSEGTLASSYVIQFTSTLIPMYAEPYDIREAAMGYVSDSVPDYIIAKMIHTNSKRIAIINNVDYYSGETISARLYDQMVRYVICKTAYDLLRSPLVSTSAFGGRIASKSLGDLSISYDYGKDSDTPVNELKDELKACYESYVSIDMVSTNVKSSKDDYYPGRRRAISRVKNPAEKASIGDEDIVRDVSEIT